MDVEKTMLFILESQRKAELRADRADRRMDRFDQQLQATATLVRRGIKLVESLAKAQKDTDQKLNALIDSQLRTEDQLRKTDEKLNRFLEGMRRRNGNGHKN